MKTNSFPRIIVAALTLGGAGWVGLTAKEIRPIYAFAIVKPEPKEPMLWEDKDLSVRLESDGTWITIMISNKSSSVAKLIWNDCSFSDTKGASSKLIPSETIKIDLDRARPDAIILPGSAYKAKAFPRADYIDIGSQAIMVGFIPVGCMDAVGKTFQVYLPIQFDDGTRHNMLFKVKVIDAKPAE